MARLPLLILALAVSSAIGQPAQEEMAHQQLSQARLQTLADGSTNSTNSSVGGSVHGNLSSRKVSILEDLVSRIQALYAVVAKPADNELLELVQDSAKAWSNETCPPVSALQSISA